MKLIFTCEHAVNHIPNEYASFFHPHQAELNSHRGIDYGARSLAEYLSAAFHAQLFMPKVSRFLIDCNRSLHHRSCFTEVSRVFAADMRQDIMETYYQPYRNQVIQCIESHVKKGQKVLHLSIHSFTPVLHEIIREAEIGLLYDPARVSEKAMAKLWRQQLKKDKKDWRTRLNYPYKGTADGFTTALRRQFADCDYLGIEVECNQKLSTQAILLPVIGDLLENSLRAVLYKNQS